MEICFTEKEKHLLLNKIASGDKDMTSKEYQMIPILINERLVIDVSSSMGEAYMITPLGEVFLDKKLFQKGHSTNQRKKAFQWTKNQVYSFLKWAGSLMIAFLLGCYKDDLQEMISRVLNSLISYIK